MTRVAIVLLFIGAVGCQKGTFVSLSFTQAVALPATARIDLALMLGGIPATTSFSAPDGKSFSFPASATLEIGSGAGSMSVNATAYDGSGKVIDGASGTVDVVSDKTVALSLALGGPVMDMDIDDLAGSDMMPAIAAPSAPQNVVASGGNAQATVSWTAPANMGGSAITSYTITPSPAGTPITTSGATATFTGLTNDTTYVFTVVATNAAGNGPPATSNQVTPTAMPTAPSAPTTVTAIANIDHGATVNWTASDNHGSPLQGYAVAATQLTGTLGTAGPTATSTTVTGLTPGSQYTFTVTATNSIGTSNPSLPSSAIVAATLPGKPTGLTANLANAPDGANLSWTAPASNGFSAITQYTITATPGDVTATTPDGNTTSLKMTGLTAGTQYTLSLTATNLIGTGPAWTLPLIPLNTLPSPTGVTACAADGEHIKVNFDSVTGASSYDVFYSPSPPATSGMKINVVSTSATPAPATSGSYYVAVAAVNAVGDGVASPDQLVIVDSHVHDTLFVANAANIDIYDCYSQIPSSTSTPTRSVTITYSGYQIGDSPLSVDPVNAVIWVSNQGSSAQNQVLGFTNAKTISGTVVNPNYSFQYSAGNGEIAGTALDSAHQKLYVAVFNTGGNGFLGRFGYTTPSDLQSTSVAEIQFVYPGPDSPTALYVNQANGDLWVATNTVEYYAAAQNATNDQAPTKQFTLTSGGATVFFNGISYSPNAGGTLYVSNHDNIYWLVGVDALSGGTYAVSGSVASPATSLYVAGPLLFEMAYDSKDIFDWNVVSITGSPLKTVSDATAHISGGVVYIP